MSEAVSKHDVEKMNYEYKKTINTLIIALLTKIKKSGRKIDDQVTIKVGRENVYRSVGNKPVENQLNPDNVKQIQTALENPQNLKGSVTISIGNEKIFHVKDGQVIKDSLNLISNQQAQSRETNIQFGDTLKQAKGRDLLQYAQEMLKRIVKNTREDGSKIFESKHYIFKEKNKQLSVTAKDGRGEIFNNNGFTNIATENDIDSLQKIKRVVEKLKVENPVKKVASKSLHQ